MATPRHTTARARHATVVLMALGWSAGCGSPPPPETARRHRGPEAPASPSASVAADTPAATPTAHSATAIAAPPPADALGTAHPVIVDAASPAGSWVVACQARHDTDGDGTISVTVGPRGELGGDQLLAYLLTGAGPGHPIDELLAADPTGRWLVLREEGRPWLVDTTGTNRVDLEALGADSRSDAIPYADHRSFTFDAAGTKLAYVRERASGTEIVVRTLASGDERIVVPGPGKLWRARLDMTGNWVVVEMITEDTSGNGRLGWPVPERERLPHRCAGPLPRYAAWQDRGDQPATLVAPASGGRAKLMTSLVAPLRDRLLVRLPGGEIYTRTWRGKRVRFGDGECLGHLVHADVDRELALFACEQEEGRPLLELRGPGYRQQLEIPVAGQAVRTWPTANPRLVPIYPGQDALLVDFARKSTVPLKPRDTVLGVVDAHALVRREDHLVLVDVDATSERPLAALPDAIPDILIQEPVVVVSPLVIDVARGEVLGTISRRPLAATTDGHVLVVLGAEASADRLAIGPLQWQRPHPPSAPATASE